MSLCVDVLLLLGRASLYLYILQIAMRLQIVTPPSSCHASVEKDLLHISFMNRA